MTDNEYIDFISKFLKITVNFTKNINLLLLTFKNQISYGDEINSLITNTFLSCNFSTFPKYINDLIKNDLFKKNILLLEKILLKINDLTSANDVTDIINTIKNETNLKGRELYLPIRYIAIGQEHGPEMDKILLIVGKKKIIENISIIKKKLK
jgi:glutamyl/glutaminyl-tRNA synthetase